MGRKARLIDVDHLKKQFIGGMSQQYSKLAIMNIIDDEPKFNGRECEFGRWDILIHKKTMDRWEADAQCSQCGFTITCIWSGYFPDIPDAIARNAADAHSKKISLNKYCRQCGARMNDVE